MSNTSVLCIAGLGSLIGQASDTTDPDAKHSDWQTKIISSCLSWISPPLIMIWTLFICVDLKDSLQRETD